MLSSAVLLSGESYQPETQIPADKTSMERISIAAAETAAVLHRKPKDIPVETENIALEEQSEEETEKIIEAWEEMTEEATEESEEAYVYESAEPDEQEIYEEYTEGYQPVYFSEGFDSSFKAYMDYRCITDTGSIQYQLQQEAYTDERGFRKIGDDYCVALGTGITDGCCERFLITLDSGYSFSAIVSDVKADIHTDSTNTYAPRGENSGNIVEFIIDSDNADGYMLNCGSAGCFEDLSGNVISIEKI